MPQHEVLASLSVGIQCSLHDVQCTYMYTFHFWGGGGYHTSMYTCPQLTPVLVGNVLVSVKKCLPLSSVVCITDSLLCGE